MVLEFTNIDETTTSKVQKPQKVVKQKCFKQFNQATSGEKGAHVTTCYMFVSTNLQ